MSPKKPVNFMPPDDPTAVYPIGSLRMDDTDEEGTPAPITDPERIPSRKPMSAPGPNPLIAAAAIGVGMLLMGVFATVVAVGFLFL